MYQNIKIDKQILEGLPENGILPGVTMMECTEIEDADNEIGIDTGPGNSDNEEKVYNDESEMSSCLPSNIHKKKEKRISSMINFLTKVKSMLGR